jgi:hypothetical protein
MTLPVPPEMPTHNSDSGRLSRKPATLDRQLLAYTLAGVGAIAFTPLASAEIIYTPADITLRHGNLPLDFNSDGVTDFVLRETSFYSTSVLHSAKVRLSGVPRSPEVAVLGRVGDGREPGALALTLGSSIGPNSPQSFVPLQTQAAVLAEIYCYRGCKDLGSWANVSHKYLGLRFEIHGEVHYGWVRLSIAKRLWLEVKVEGYAYETTPDHPILAGKKTSFDDASLSDEEAQPKAGSLGALARGAQPAQNFGSNQ